jgi:hypothetical protein
MVLSFYNQLTDKKKLVFILSIALFFRLIAAVFSSGYAMHDDHFLVVETPSSWVHGYDSGYWLPKTQKAMVEEGRLKEMRPQGHSLTYYGFHYMIFKTFDSIGVENPKTQMFIIRLLHAFLGVFVVYLVFLLSQLISNKKTALELAWIAALGWAFSFLSVRNLVEVVCIPFLLAAVILSIKGVKRKAVSFGLVAGLLMALAVSIRYQTVVFFGVFGMLLLVKQSFKLAFSILGGFVFCFILLQGLPDYLIWGYPFAELMEYFLYNASDARFDYAADLSRNYGLNYLAVLALITVPLLGVFWFIGFFTQWKKQFLLFWPAIAFLVFHMSYINTQERFIFPVLHIVLILGYIGWQSIKEKRGVVIENKTLWKTFVALSWTLNFVLLLALSTYYVKKSRVESASTMIREDAIYYIVQENTIKQETPYIPLFYAQKWEAQCYDVYDVAYYDTLPDVGPGKVIYIFFYGIEMIDQRLNFAKNKFPTLTFVGKYDPSFIDMIVHKLNPVNRNETITVYRFETK